MQYINKHASLFTFKLCYLSVLANTDFDPFLLVFDDKCSTGDRWSPLYNVRRSSYSIHLQERKGIKRFTSFLFYGSVETNWYHFEHIKSIDNSTLSCKVKENVSDTIQILDLSLG